MTSASFTPPAGSVIVVRASSYAGSGDDSSTITISDTLGLTWTKQVERSQGDDGGGTIPPPIAIFTAVGTGAAMTVTTTRSNGVGFNHVQCIHVLTGANTTTPVVDTAEQSTTGAMSLSLDTPVDDCMLIGGMVDWLEGADVPVADANSTTDYAIATGTIQGSWGGHRGVGAAGTYTIGTSFPSSGTDTNAVAVAIQPAAGGGGSTVYGTGSAALGPLTATLAGKRIVKGTGSAAFGPLSATLTGKRIVQGSGLAALGPLVATLIVADASVQPGTLTTGGTSPSLTSGGTTATLTTG